MRKTVEKHLLDIDLYIDRIQSSLENVDETVFSQSLDLQDMTLRRIEVFGEATKRIPLVYRDKYPEVEWKKIAGTRDIISHEYEGVDMHLVWVITRTELPKLKLHVQKMLKDADFEYES